MPKKQIIDDEVWGRRIENALKYREEWENLFQCSNLEAYYEGRQYKHQDKDDPQYVVNKIYETLEIKLDSFMSADFAYNVNPRPFSSDFDLEGAAISAQLKEAVLNTLVGNDDVYFSSEVKSAYRDSYFRFGVFEVGYAADWIFNPNHKAPGTNYDSKEFADGKPKRNTEPEEIAVSERVYFKHIPARDFLVGGLDHKYLNRCTFYGYKEWVHKSDLLAIPGLMNRDKIDQSVGVAESPDETSDGTQRENNIDKGEAIAIWHLWDNKYKIRVIVLDDSWVTIWQTNFTRQCIFDYRHTLRACSEGFYPVPPVFHWLSPQRELNEIREQMKNHRKKFIRQYQAIENTVDPEEIDKFEAGEDGVIIITKRENAIQPIATAQLTIETDKMAAMATDDINQLSGTSVNNRGEASNRTTATESTLIDQRASLRENAEKVRISKWLSRIGREVLLIARDRFVFGLWVEITADSKETLFAELQANQAEYIHVTSEDLKDGYDFRIAVDPIQFSSVSREEEKQKFLEFIAVVSQYPQLAMSPKLIREAAYRIGYRNEAVIREMQQMALVAQYGAMAQLPGMGNVPGMAQNKVAQMTPPGMEQIRQQLTTQIGS